MASCKMKSCTLLWREAHFEVKSGKSHHSTSTFGSGDVEKHVKFGPMWEKCTPLWREVLVEVNMYKTHHSRTTFGSGDVQKVHAIVARRTFGSEHVENTRGSHHFLTIRLLFYVVKVHVVVTRSTFAGQKCKRNWRF